MYVMTTPRIETMLHASIDNLYVGSEEFLNEIETGPGTKRLYAPKVGYQGVAGSFGKQAVRECFGDTASSITNYKEFDNVFAALETRTIDYGVLPIENSTTGDVLEVSSQNAVCMSPENTLSRYATICSPSPARQPEGSRKSTHIRRQ